MTEQIPVRWIARQEDIHNQCEGHAICDLVATVTAWKDQP